MSRTSNLEFYCSRDAERERFYEIFFMLCRKYRIDWSSATEKERGFIEEVTRLTYAHDKVRRKGMEPIRPSFVS